MTAADALPAVMIPPAARIPPIALIVDSRRRRARNIVISRFPPAPKVKRHPVLSPLMTTVGRLGECEERSGISIPTPGRIFTIARHLLDAWLHRVDPSADSLTQVRKVSQGTSVAEIRWHTRTGRERHTGCRSSPVRVRCFARSGGVDEGRAEVGVDGVLRNPEGPPHPNGRQLATMHEPVDRHLRHAHDRGDLGHGQEPDL